MVAGSSYDDPGEGKRTLWLRGALEEHTDLATPWILTKYMAGSVCGVCVSLMGGKGLGNEAHTIAVTRASDESGRHRRLNYQGHTTSRATKEWTHKTGTQVWCS